MCRFCLCNLLSILASIVSCSVNCITSTSQVVVREIRSDFNYQTNENYYYLNSDWFKLSLKFYTREFHIAMYIIFIVGVMYGTTTISN